MGLTEVARMPPDGSGGRRRHAATRRLPDFAVRLRGTLPGPRATEITPAPGRRDRRGTEKATRQTTRQPQSARQTAPARRTVPECAQSLHAHGAGRVPVAAQRP